MLDAYTRRARLAPAVLAAAPAMAMLGSGLWSPRDAASIGAIVLGTASMVLCGVVRAAGRRLEPALWESWGGPPTTRALRWRESSNDAATKRLHERVAAAVGRPIPTRRDESSDPADADIQYEEAIAALRNLTRSRHQFPLVADEVAEYGFRRNCLGIRPVALVVAALVAIAATVILLWPHPQDPSRFVAAAIVGLVAFFGWGLGVRPDWVRTSADLYARRLLEAAEVVGRRQE